MKVAQTQRAAKPPRQTDILCSTDRQKTDRQTAASTPAIPAPIRHHHVGPLSGSAFSLGSQRCTFEVRLPDHFCQTIVCQFTLDPLSGSAFSLGRLECALRLVFRTVCLTNCFSVGLLPDNHFDSSFVSTLSFAALAVLWKFVFQTVCLFNFQPDSGQSIVDGGVILAKPSTRSVLLKTALLLTLRALALTCRGDGGR